jgi:hypothetical protein
VAEFRKPILILRCDLKHAKSNPSLKEDKMREGGSVALMEEVRNADREF